jgi:hypothetical protein
MESENLLQQLTDRVNTLLDLCDPNDTPIICDMISSEESKQKLVDLIIKKVVEQKINVEEAIIAVNNEYDPNSID